MMVSFCMRKETKTDMREADALNVTYQKDDYVSVFVGLCESKELLAKYMEKDYELLECGCIGFELGVDFGINTYDEDFMAMVWHEKMSDSIETIFKDAVQTIYSDKINESYNVAIVIGNLKYEGQIQEVHNEEFGYFKFLDAHKLE